MSFCATCGRQRNGTARFCGGCGTEFSDPVPTGGDREPLPEDARHPAAEDTAPPGPAGDETRLNADPGVTRAEPPAAQTDPFASWYQKGAPVGGQAADMNWNPTQTVYAAPTGASEYPSSSFTPGNPFSSANPVIQPAPPTRPPRSGGRGKGPLFIAVAVIVVLAAGGGAYALTSSLSGHQGASPSPSPTLSGSAPAAGTAAATSPPATPSSQGGTSAPSATLSLVAISPDVAASAAQPHVEELLSHYFHGINAHSYQEYASTLNAAQRASQPRSAFESGYSSTTDSKMTLTALSGDASGGPTATVTFTSRQSPAQSVDHSACNAWTLNLYLVPHGSGYLIGPAPSGYHPTYSDC